MSWLSDAGGPLLVAWLLTVLAGVVAVCVLRYGRVRRGWVPAWALRASVSEVGIVVGTWPWLWLLFTPAAGERGVDLVPLRDLVDVFAAGPTTIAMQLGGNLVFCAALGFFLPIRFRCRLGAVLVAGLGLSVGVEALQYALDLGRVSAVDDVLLNVLGGLAAAVLSRRWWRERRVPEAGSVPNRDVDGVHP